MLHFRHCRHALAETDRRKRTEASVPLRHSPATQYGARSQTMQQCFNGSRHSRGNSRDSRLATVVFSPVLLCNTCNVQLYAMYNFMQCTTLCNVQLYAMYNFMQCTTLCNVQLYAVQLYKKLQMMSIKRSTMIFILRI